MNLRHLGLVVLLATTSTLAAAPTSHHRSIVSDSSKSDANTTLTKNIDRTFAVNATGDLKLDNRYGEIRYRIGAGNEVKVAIRISAEASTAAKAQAILDRIDVKVDGSKSAVSVQTVMDGGIVSNSWTVFGNGDNGKKSFKIDYEITAPAGFALDAKNRFGNTFLDNMTAAAQIDVQYGDLTAGKLGSPSKVEIAYGNGSIGDAKVLDARIRYSKLKMSNAAQATVYARYSELKMGRIGTLDLDSQYSEHGIQSVRTLNNSGGFDDLKVDSVWSFGMKGGYCDVKVGYLGDDADIRMTYGDMHINATSATLNKITFNGSYTDLTAAIHPAVQYRLTAEARYGDITTPGGFTMVKEISKSTTEKVEGHHGANPKAEFVLYSSFGDLVLK